MACKVKVNVSHAKMRVVAMRLLGCSEGGVSLCVKHGGEYFIFLKTSLLLTEAAFI